MSLLQRKHGKQDVKVEDHLNGDVDEEAGQSARMRMSPMPIARAALSAAATPCLPAAMAPLGSTPRRGLKVTKTGSEQNSSRPGEPADRQTQRGLLHDREEWKHAH
jgi:hypothetical protein